MEFVLQQGQKKQGKAKQTAVSAGQAMQRGCGHSADHPALHCNYIHRPAHMVVGVMARHKCSGWMGPDEQQLFVLQEGAMRATVSVTADNNRNSEPDTSIYTRVTPNCHLDST